MPDDVGVARMIDEAEDAEDRGPDLVEAGVSPRPRPIFAPSPRKLHLRHLMRVARQVLQKGYFVLTFTIND